MLGSYHNGWTVYLTDRLPPRDRHGFSVSAPALLTAVAANQSESRAARAAAQTTNSANRKSGGVAHILVAGTPMKNRMVHQNDRM